MAEREKLPDVRQSVTHKFSILAREGEIDGRRRTDGVREYDFYITIGLYPDGRVGELFVMAHNEYGAIGALLDCMAMSFSVAVQHGAPLDSLCSKYMGQRFEPSGSTSNPAIPRALSPVDYIGRWLLKRFGTAP